MTTVAIKNSLKIIEKKSISHYNALLFFTCNVFLSSIVIIPLHMKILDY